MVQYWENPLTSWISKTPYFLRLTPLQEIFPKTKKYWQMIVKLSGVKSHWGSNEGGGGEDFAKSPYMKFC